MSNYTIVTNFLSKDSLISGNPLKAVKGADFTTEFTAVQTALNSKFDGVVQFAPDGTAGQPSFGFTNNAGTGMYNAAGVLSFATNSVKAASIATSGAFTSFVATGSYGNTVTPGGTAQFSGYQITNAATSRTLEVLYAGATSAGIYGAAANTSVINAQTGLTLSTNDTARLAINSAGNVTVNAPASGTALSVTGVSAGAALSLTASGGGNCVLASSGTVGGTSYGFSNSGGTGMWSSAVSNLDFATGGTNRLNINSSGNVTVNAPSSGVSLVVNGINGAGTSAFEVQGGTTAGDRGLLVQAGTGSTSYNSIFQSANGSVQIATIAGDGSFVLAAPTGGNQGLGTLNATGLFVNGVTLSPVASGTFTATLTGCTTSPTTTCTYRIVNGICTIDFGAGVQGTSNTTACTVTGLPAACQPAATQSCVVMLENNSAPIFGVATVQNASGTITFSATALALAGTTFTAAGAKGVNSCTMAYRVN